ncbi:MAG: NAD(+) diphosphatase [Pseudomonadales bacterium]|nr:NAD(+) diphosphatase [Pseudomonadales bacterium]
MPFAQLCFPEVDTQLLVSVTDLVYFKEMTTRGYFLDPNDLRESDRFILFNGNQVIIRGDEFVWTFEHLDVQLLPDFQLLLVEEKPSGYVAVQGTSILADQLKAENRSLRSLLFVQQDYDFSVIGKASQIIDWYGSHQFCGSCGGSTEHHEIERAVCCLKCNNRFYPRINPCAIVLVVRGRKVLLARSARFRTGFYSCLAGFIEIGETAEETVLREVKEEVGICVNNVRYIKSQSWPFPSQLMLGFIAEYESGEIEPEPEEIEEADWYDIDQLPNIPLPGISVAGELIQYYSEQVRSGLF